MRLEFRIASDARVGAVRGRECRTFASSTRRRHRCLLGIRNLEHTKALCHGPLCLVSLVVLLVLGDAFYVALSLGLHWRVHLVIVELVGVAVALGILLVVSQCSRAQHQLSLRSSSIPLPQLQQQQQRHPLQNVLVG